MSNYKFSSYNIFLNYKNNYICFNSLSGAIFTINRDNYEIIKKSINKPKKIIGMNDNLFNILKKTRMVIKKEINELDIIKFRNRRDAFLNNSYRIGINPTLDCNFKCWYCYESHPKGKMTKDIMKRIEIFINNLIEEKKISGLEISWFGGEPLLYFKEVVFPLSLKFKQIMESYDMKFLNDITTNGYLIDTNVLDMCDKIDLRSFQITIDGTKDRHNKSRILVDGGFTFDKIITNIILIATKLSNSRIHLRINYDNETLQDIEKVLEYFPKNIRSQIIVHFRRIWQTYDNDISLNEKLKKLVNLCNDLGFISSTTSSDFILNKGITCYAERWHESIINYDGNVFKCSARDFTEENSCGYLCKDGKIKWKAEKIINMFSKPKFENDMCLNCKLLPMCLGPCIQKILEVGNNDLEKICTLRSLELSVEDFVINRYKQLLRKREKGNNNISKLNSLI